MFFGFDLIMTVAAAPVHAPDAPYPDWKYVVYTAGAAVIAAVCVFNWISAARERDVEREKQFEQLAKETKKSAAPKIHVSRGLDDDMFD